MPEPIVMLLLLVVGYGIGYNLHRIALDRWQAKSIPIKVERKQ